MVNLDLISEKSGDTIQTISQPVSRGGTGTNSNDPLRPTFLFFYSVYPPCHTYPLAYYPA